MSLSAHASAQQSRRFLWRCVLLGGLLSWSVARAGEAPSATLAEIDTFESGFAARCVRDQRGSKDNESLSDLMIVRTCACTAKKLSEATLRGGLLDGIDAAREKDVFWGRASRLLAQCTRELVPPIPEGAQWSRVSSGLERDVSIDSASLHREGHVVTAYLMEDYRVARLMGTLKFKSMKVRTRYDCVSGTQQATFFYLFAGNRATGQLVTTVESSAPPLTVPPGSNADVAWQAVCKEVVP